MWGLIIALLRSCLLTSTKKEDAMTVDDKPTVSVAEPVTGSDSASDLPSAAGSTSAAGVTLDASLRGLPKPLRIRTPSGLNCSSCPDFKILSDPVEVEEWTCDSCVTGA